ncbi:MAG: hypothetical protein IZT55_04050 [Anaerolineae bacterium]|nr:hypothetical protein [Anaerolineae bacterium]
MDIATAAPYVVGLVTITATIILVSRDWRVSISAMGAQYVGVLLLVALSWPLELAVIKLIAGWIAAASLGISLIENPKNLEHEVGYWISGGLFRVFTAGMMGLAMLSLRPTVAEWAVHATFNQILGSMILMSFGLLHLGFTTEPDRIILGLLTILSGFEIIYCTMEASLLVNAFLAVITLGIALIGAFLLTLPKLETE